MSGALGSAAAGTPTHQWFFFADSSGNLLGITNDDTSTAWGIQSAKMLTLATPYTIPTDGFYYIGIMVAATTVPNLQGVAASNGVVANLSPSLSWIDNSHTGLTNPASAPSTFTPTNQTQEVYAYFS
jgi:hypothetical protein